MWSAACIIAELYTGELYFATVRCGCVVTSRDVLPRSLTQRDVHTQHDNLEHLGLMEQALGRFPPEMIAKSPVRRTYFSADGSVRWDDLDRESRRHIRNTKTIEVDERVFVNLFEGNCSRSIASSLRLSATYCTARIVWTGRDALRDAAARPRPPLRSSGGAVHALPSPERRPRVVQVALARSLKGSVARVNSVSLTMQGCCPPPSLVSLLNLLSKPGNNPALLLLCFGFRHVTLPFSKFAHQFGFPRVAFSNPSRGGILSFLHFIFSFYPQSTQRHISHTNRGNAHSLLNHSHHNLCVVL